MDGARRLSRVFVELADTMVEEFDVLDLLQTLTDRCVEVLPVDAAGLVLADERGRSQPVASASAVPDGGAGGPGGVEALLPGLLTGEGPCQECLATGRAASFGAAEVRTRWPAFAAASAAAGLHAVHALPMRLRSTVLGAVTLFTARDAPLDEGDVVVAQAMADVATIGLLHERTLRAQTAVSQQLQTALHSRIVIEQAKGVLAARSGTSVATAFTRLRRYARQEGRTLTAVAQDVVDGRLRDVTTG